MCSIFGALGAGLNDPRFRAIRAKAKDRGRDGGRAEEFQLESGEVAALGNWRATPTPELERAELQPYDGIVHNGTIANDEELGRRPGEIDSQVLPRILNRKSFDAFVESLALIRGSFAIGAVARDSLYLATNYKPLHVWAPQGGSGVVYFASMERHFSMVLPFGQRPWRVPTYTAVDLRTRQRRSIRAPGNIPRRAVVIASGGLDSTVAAAQLRHDGYEVAMLHFLYGCRAERREKDRVTKLAAGLEATAHFIELPVGGGPLCETGAEISSGMAGAEYAHEWVPARNLAMLGLAAAWAEGHGYHVLALGNNLEEAGAYPDNEEIFTLLYGEALEFATQANYALRLVSPVGRLMKHEIVALGVRLGAPLELTWSCYQGGERHCGNCGPCFMRRTAFERNGLTDPVFA